MFSPAARAARRSAVARDPQAAWKAARRAKRRAAWAAAFAPVANPRRVRVA